MKKNLLLLIPVAGAIGLSFYHSSNKISTYHADGIETITNSFNPPAAKTGAPGEGNCTECHIGEAMSSDGVVFFTLSGGPSYTPGTNYPITISTLDGARNGFELTILDEENNKAGSFTAGDNSNVTTSGGKEYIRHTSSDGAVSWTFSWTAPDTDMGELTAYYSFNKANNNGANSGDQIFLGSESIPLMGASIAENRLEKAYKVFFDNKNKVLNVNYALFKEAKVVLNIQDLSGRLIEFYDFGVQQLGDYNEEIQLPQLSESGVYLVSLFIDNRVLNRKVYLN